MQEVGKKIKEIRKRKGLSQEELAESATVNLRTIQRIEKNESEPRGKTLNLICHALEINAEELLDYGKERDRNYIIFIHLSVVTFLFFPLGNVILPLILWFNKKDKIVGVKETGANLLNFQIPWTILTFLAVILYAYLQISHLPGARIVLFFFLGLYLLNIFLPVVFAVLAGKGKSPKYPSPATIVK